MRESEALGQLDHPGNPARLRRRCRRETSPIGSATGSTARGCATRSRRGPRPIPVGARARARPPGRAGACPPAGDRPAQHRAFAPSWSAPAGRATVTDVRHCSYCLPAIPSGTRPPAPAFMAPEVRDGAPGDPASDIYTVGALLYFAVTGQEPAPDPAEVRRPTELRPACPQVIERIVLRALQPAAGRPVLHRGGDAGGLRLRCRHLRDTRRRSGSGPIISADEDRARWEKRLRRALGDDYELPRPAGHRRLRPGVPGARPPAGATRSRSRCCTRRLTRDPEVVERFRREAQLAAGLDHPNIVNIYEIGGRSGLIWYTMELIDGPSLAQLVERDRARCPLDQVLRLLREALSALAHAHGLGLVHRDIKPENMLIASGREPADHRLRAGAGASGKVRGRHQSERNTPVCQSRAAPRGAGGPALRPLQPGRGRVLRPAGAAAIPRPHGGAGARQADHQPVPGRHRAARGCQRRAAGGARSGAAARTPAARFRRRRSSCRR